MLALERGLFKPPSKNNTSNLIWDRGRCKDIYRVFLMDSRNQMPNTIAHSEHTIHFYTDKVYLLGNSLWLATDSHSTFVCKCHRCISLCRIHSEHNHIKGHTGTILKHKSRQHKGTKAKSLNFSSTLNIFVFRWSRTDLQGRKFYWSHKGHFSTCRDIVGDTLAHNMSNCSSHLFHFW